MANIKNNFIVNMAANSFYRYVDKVADGVKRSEKLRQELVRVAQAGFNMAKSFGAARAPATQTENKFVEISNATENLIERLGGLENKLKTALTDRETDRAMQNLQHGMERVGLVWTEQAQSIGQADLLAQNSLQQLAEQGFIKASDAAEQLAQSESWAEQEAEKQQHSSNLLAKALFGVAGGAAKAAKGLLGIGKASNPLDGVVNRMTRMVVTLFSVRRILRYVTDAMARAPDRIASSFDTLKTNIQDTFARVVVSGLAGAQQGVDRLNAALDSPAGQRFFRGLEQAAQLAGAAVGWLMEKAGGVIEWLGGHSEQVFTTAAIAAAFFAAQLLAVNASALLAAAPIIGIIGLAAALVVGLNAAGVTSEQIFEKIGQGAGFLYAFVYNLAADAHNLWASFAEFFANVFNDTLSAVAHLFIDVFDTILGVVETVAGAIDTLLHSNLSGAISGFRSQVQAWADDKFGAKAITIDRKEKISYQDTMDEWGQKAAEIPSRFSGISLAGMAAQEINPTLNGIKGDTSALRKAVDMTEEDLKSFVDLAERRYVNNVNLTTVRPQIVVNGQNTGNTEADGYALAGIIQQILAKETASGSFVATGMP